MGVGEREIESQRFRLEADSWGNPNPEKGLTKNCILGGPGHRRESQKYLEHENTLPLCVPGHFSMSHLPTTPLLPPLLLPQASWPPPKLVFPSGWRSLSLCPLDLHSAVTLTVPLILILHVSVITDSKSTAWKIDLNIKALSNKS